jgi:magnesium-transporting ATPase (P-type)
MQVAATSDASAVLREHRVDGDAGLPSSALPGLRALRAAQRGGAGTNELAAKEEPPMWRRFADKLREPMTLLLLASAAVSVATGQTDDAISISSPGVGALVTGCRSRSRTHWAGAFPNCRRNQARKASESS